MVCAMKLPCGIVTMMSGSLNGGFAFMDGRIVGAFVDETGARGEQALNTLAALAGARCDFMPFDRHNVQQEATHMRDVITTSEPVLDPHSLSANKPQIGFDDAPTNQPADNPPVQQQDAGSPSPDTPTGSLPVVVTSAPMAVTHTEPAADPLAGRRSRIAITPLVASTLFKHFVAAENLQDFLEEDGHLTEAPTLNEAQLRLLDIVRELTDPELFEEKSEVDLKDSTSLTTDQKQDLTIFAGVTSPLDFVRSTGQLDFQGLQVTEEQMVELGQVLAARSLAQQKEEFVEQTGIPADAEETVLKDFVEPAAPDTVPDKEEGRPTVLGKAGFASDYADLSGVHVDEVDAKYEAPGFKAEAAEEKTKPTKDVHYSKYMAPAAVAFLCVTAFIFPLIIHVSTPAVSDPQLAAEQTRLLINDEIKAQSPRNQRPVPAQTVAPAQASGAAAASVVFDDPADNDPLAQAAVAKADGNYQKAIAILEDALSSNPQAVPVRIELIRMYKKQKNFKRARALAVIGFRAPGNTPKQRDDLWELFMQCCESKAHP